MMDEKKLLELLKLQYEYNPNTGRFTSKVTKNTLLGISTNPKQYRSMVVGTSMQLQHRMAWLYHYGTMAQNIKHKNGIRSDNRIDNLVDCTKSQIYRSKKAVNKTSRYIGVHKHNNAYIASINDSGMLYLGRFTKEEDAARAYDKAAYKRDPNFCTLNFPTEFNK